MRLNSGSPRCRTRFCEKSRSTRTALSGPWCNSLLRSATSPKCEFGFPAACARSVENAASAKNSVLPRSRKTSHWCRVQRGSKVELTECGQSCRSLRLRQWPLLAVCTMLYSISFHWFQTLSQRTFRNGCRVLSMYPPVFYCRDFSFPTAVVCTSRPDDRQTTAAG